MATLLGYITITIRYQKFVVVLKLDFFKSATKYPSCILESEENEWFYNPQNILREVEQNIFFDNLRWQICSKTARLLSFPNSIVIPFCSTQKPWHQILHTFHSSFFFFFFLVSEAPKFENLFFLFLFFWSLFSNLLISIRIFSRIFVKFSDSIGFGKNDTMISVYGLFRISPGFFIWSHFSK